MRIDPATRVTIPSHVVFRSFVEETVLLNLKSGRYHGLNATAGRMLELLGEHGDPAAVAARVAEEYDASAERVRVDVDALCADLLARGLVEVGDVPG